MLFFFWIYIEFKLERPASLINLGRTATHHLLKTKRPRPAKGKHLQFTVRVGLWGEAGLVELGWQFSVGPDILNATHEAVDVDKEYVLVILIYLHDL
jgi:hypothetical protein